MKILIRKHHGTIYPERGGYTGVIDLGYDGRGNRLRIKKKGRTKQEVKERCILRLARAGVPLGGEPVCRCR